MSKHGKDIQKSLQSRLRHLLTGTWKADSQHVCNQSPLNPDICVSTGCNTPSSTATMSDSTSFITASCEEITSLPAAEDVNPINPDWLKNWSSWMEQNYRNDHRTERRIQVLDTILYIINHHRNFHEDSLIEHVVMPFLRDIDEESDPHVRTKGVQFIVNLLMLCSSNVRCVNFIEIINRVLIRSLERIKNRDENVETVLADYDGVDVEAAVEGLCDVIRQRFYERPQNSAVEAFKLLLTHLNAHYELYSRLEKYSWSFAIRKKIMTLLLSVRVKTSGQVGLVKEATNEVVYSPYYTFKAPSAIDSPGSSTSAANNTSPSQTPISFTKTLKVPTLNCPLPLNDLFPMIITSLEKERDWNALNAILLKLPLLLTSEALIHQTSPVYIGKFTHTLCNMIEDSAYFQSINNLPERFSKTAFQTYIFPILSNLISYHKLIDSNNQTSLVKNLNVGLVNAQSKNQCITALALCVVELQDTMVKQLPKLLLDLSKISATISIANPLLEFLSYATLDPRLYASFTPDQYLNIFATILPFTNPSKFSEYIVAMAFRVMSMWFLKCRMAFRKIFIKYIVKGMRINVMAPIEEISQSDESRKRSGSFNSEAAVKSTDSQSSTNASNTNPPSTTNSASFHSNREFFKELVESHMDLLARYTQGLCSTVPETPSGQEMLLERSQSSTWIIGQRLLTITTSGCRARTFVDGLCERCYRLCKSSSTNDPMNDDVFNPLKSDASSFMSMMNDNDFHSSQFTQISLNSLQHSNSTGNTTSAESVYSERNLVTSRRRHQSAFVPNNSSKPVSRAFDDSHLNFTSSTYSSGDDYEESSICSCWCEGWAEILIRRPSGTTCWKMRIQNRLNVPCYPYNPFDMFNNDLTPIYSSRTLKSETDTDSGVVRGEDPLAADSDLNSSPPVFRRTSSSPDMERAENAISSPTDRKILDSQESLDDSPGDSNSVKISRASSLGRGDSVKQTSFTRSSSFSWKSPSRYKKSEPSSPNAEVVRKETSTMTFATSSSGASVSSSKKDQLQLDLKSELTDPNHHSPMKHAISSTSSSSSLVATSSNVTANSRTPPKTQHKLEGISEVKPSENNIGNVVPRGRLATISVMSPAQVKPPVAGSFKRASSNQRITEMSNPRNDGIKPSFIFLQFFYDASIKNDGISTKNDGKMERPLLLPKTETIRNALSNLDRILPHEMHKIGIVYVDTDQTKDISAILSNRHGSYRYTQFLRGIGNIIPLKDIDTSKCYIGGLAQNGEDGKLAISWQDNLTQVIFHVSTFMPNKESDPDHKAKRAHIGNDCVCIIYNNSGQLIDVNHLKFGKFLLAAVVIDPLDFERNVVAVQFFDEGLIEVIGRRDSVVISDSALPSYVRQLSINLNIGSLIYHSRRSVSKGSQYASNCVERLRQIERIKKKAMMPNQNEEAKRGSSFISPASNNRSTIINSDGDDSIYCDKFIEDFTSYI